MQPQASKRKATEPFSGFPNSLTKNYHSHHVTNGRTYSVMTEETVEDIERSFVQNNITPAKLFLKVLEDRDYFVYFLSRDISLKNRIMALVTRLSVSDLKGCIPSYFFLDKEVKRVEIVCKGGVRVPTNSDMLTYKNEYWKKVLANREKHVIMIDAQGNFRINLTQFTADTIQNYLKYLSEGEFPKISDLSVFPLLELSKLIGDSKLEKLCVEDLQRALLCINDTDLSYLKDLLKHVHALTDGQLVRELSIKAIWSFFNKAGFQARTTPEGVALSVNALGILYQHIGSDFQKQLIQYVTGIVIPLTVNQEPLELPPSIRQSFKVVIFQYLRTAIPARLEPKELYAKYRIYPQDSEEVETTIATIKRLDPKFAIPKATEVHGTQTVLAQYRQAFPNARIVVESTPEDVKFKYTIPYVQGGGYLVPTPLPEAEKMITYKKTHEEGLFLVMLSGYCTEQKIKDSTLLMHWRSGFAFVDEIFNIIPGKVSEKFK